jgi:hypothetical protein
MPTNRRRRTRTPRQDVTEPELLWARDQLTESHPGYADTIYFTPPERLREVWRLAHGTPIVERIREDPPEHPGAVHANGAVVGWLSPEELAHLAWLDPWAET